VRHDDGRSLQALDHVGRGKSLARTGNPEQGLMHQPVFDALHQRIDRLGLIARGLEAGLACTSASIASG
jgi:hypothetical protein